MFIARTCEAFVVFASFAGPTSDVFRPTGDVFTETAGTSAIRVRDGVAISQTGQAAGGLAAPP